MEQLTITVVAGGKGFDPSLGTGYQVKACSAGLAGDRRQRELVTCLGTHYGQVVYDPISTAVAEARDRELEWRGQQSDRPGAVALHVLDLFPVPWTYTQLGDDLYVLARTCYRGYCPDLKPGNFFSHALVLRPDDLAACGHNPLALCRADIFRSHDPEDATELPMLESLPAFDGQSADWSALHRGPWSSRLPALLTAIACDSTRRPVVLCLADWRAATSLVEAILSLLPPSARARTTFSTYETDRYWVPSVDGTRPPGVMSAHQILALCSADDRVWNLYADDYEAKFAVFNFVSNRFSELPSPSPFADFAAECVERNEPARLNRLHELIERLGLGRSPASWDQQVAARDSLDPAEIAMEDPRSRSDPEEEQEPESLSAASDPVEDPAVVPQAKSQSAGGFLARTLKRAWEAFAGEEDPPPPSDEKSHRVRR